MRILLAFLCGLALVTPLPAGVRMKGETTEVKTGEKSEQTILLDAGRIRVDMKGARTNTSMMILGEGDNWRMIVLDANKNEYMEMDPAAMQGMQSGIQQAMAGLQEKMKDMTPEQRAMMEKMMSGRMPSMAGAGAEQPRTVYAAKGSATVNGFRCTRYEGTRGDEKVAEVCAADPGQLGVSAADFQGFEKIREWGENLRRSMASSPLGGMIRGEMMEAGFQGFPVEQKSFRSGELVRTTEVKSIERVSFSAADFSTGSARKMEMPAPGRRPR